MGTSSARPDDLDGFVRDSRAADDELRTHAARLRAAYYEFQSGTSWGQFDAHSLIDAFGRYLDLNEIDARWVAQIATAFRHAGGDGAIARLPDAAIAASLRAAGLANGRGSVTFDDPIAYGFPATTGYADDPVNTASGNFLLAETDLPAHSVTLVRTYNSRSDRPGAFGPGWTSWADARLRAVDGGAAYEGPDGQRALFPRQGAGYGRVLGVNAEVRPADEGLELRWFDGRRWTFDNTGRPISADGIAFSHGNGRLVKITHAGGRSIELTWTGDRITTAVASDGRRVDYTYVDGALVTAGDRRYEVENARIVAAVDADGVVEARNTYDADGRVLTQVSRYGRRTHFGYLPGAVTVTIGDEDDSPTNTYVHDAVGRLLAVIDGHGQRLSRTYDEWGNPVTATERNGAVTTVQWDERSHPIRRVQPDGAAFDYRYDDEDRVVEVEASTGAAVRYRYQGAERTPSEVIDAEGGVTRLDARDGRVHTVTDPDGVTLSFTFDADGALLTTTDALGNVARVERDPAGRVVATVTPLGRRTTFAYDQRGRLTERRDPAGGVWRYEYSAAGRVTAIVDPLGSRRETRYGPHGRPEADVDPLGNTTTRSYDEFGNLARLIAADGAKWDYSYDALARLTATTDPAGATWMREYDVTGNLVGSVDPVGTHHTATVDQAGRVTGLSDGLTGSVFEFDELGRAISHLRPDGTAARAGYDRCGRRTTVEDPSGGITRIEYTPAGRIHRSVSPGGRTMTFEYDAAGRLATRVDSAGRRVEFRYDADGALVERVWPAGEVETFGFDDAGRLVAHDVPGRGTTTYTPDLLGRTVAIGDPGGGVRRFAYDAAGRVSEAEDPLGGRTRYAYHPRGWLTSVTDPLGNTTTRRFDEVGRPVAETDPLGNTTTFTYDAAGRLLTRVDGAGREVRWSYDRSGRVTAITAAGGPTVTFERDALGRPVEIQEPDSYRHRLRWDLTGRLVERGRDGLALRYRYGPDGERTALEFPDGTRTTYTYDEGGQLAALQHPITGRVAFRRDSRGRLIGAESDRLTARWDYSDGLLTGYQAEAAGQQRSARLSRDTAGRVSESIMDGIALSFRYDAAGQLIAAGETTFAYDAGGRLIREAGPGGAVVYTYDAAGQLVSRGETAYEYDGSGRRVRETAADGASRAYRWNGFGQLTGVDGDHPARVTVDALGELAEIDGKSILWDSRNGPVCWLDDAPVIGQGQPWGSTPLPDWQGTVGDTRDPWGAPAGTEIGFGFRGELEFAGLTWLRNRAYHPETRSFLSRDPLPAVPGTAYAANPYQYAGNDPIGHGDPLGLRPVTDAELRAYSDDLSRNAWDKTTDWVGDNWEYLAAGAMIVGGVALMFTGVGGPAGIALMAASGGLIAGGASAGIQKFTTGEVDWGQVARDGLIGAASGGAGAGATAALSTSARLAATNPFARELLINGVDSVVSGGVERGVTGGDIFNPRALATDLLTGGAAPAPGAHLGADPIGEAEDLVKVYRFHTAADPETLRSNLSRDSLDYQDFRNEKFNGPNGPQELAAAVETHAGGDTRHSPFVSVTTDHAAAARTTDPQLGTIINGTPGPRGYEQAPDLSTFHVPRSTLHAPVNPLSTSEQELLFRGDNLADFQVDTVPNPYPK